MSVIVQALETDGLPSGSSAAWTGRTAFGPPLAQPGRSVLVRRKDRAAERGDRPDGFRRQGPSFTPPTYILTPTRLSISSARAARRCAGSSGVEPGAHRRDRHRDSVRALELGEEVAAPRGAMQAWPDFDLRRDGEGCGLPVYLCNDATAACAAELLFGRAAYARYPLRLRRLVHRRWGGAERQSLSRPHRICRIARADPGPGARGGRPADGTTAPPCLRRCTGSNARSRRPAAIPRRSGNCSTTGARSRPISTPGSTGPPKGIADARSSTRVGDRIPGGGDRRRLPATVRKRIVASSHRQSSRSSRRRGCRPHAIVEGSIGNRARAIGAASLPFLAKFMRDRELLFRDRGRERAGAGEPARHRHGSPSPELQPRRKNHDEPDPPPRGAARAGKPVRAGLIGAGKFGSMFLSQVPTIPGSRWRRSPISTRSGPAPPAGASAGTRRASPGPASSPSGARPARTAPSTWSSRRPGNPGRRHRPRTRRDRGRQADRHGQRRGRRACRSAAGPEGPREGRRLLDGLWRPAGAGRREWSTGRGRAASRWSPPARARNTCPPITRSRRTASGRTTA